MRSLAALIAALAFLWAAPALANPADGGPIGNGSVASGTVTSIVTTADVPAGSFIAVPIEANNTSSTAVLTDTATNTWSTSINFGVVSGNTKLLFGYANNTANDLPGPCTLTSVTYTTTVLTISSGGTCAAADAITTGMSAAGGGLTAGTTFNGACTLVSGAAVCNLSGNSATCASACGTVTVASVIKVTTGTSGPASVVAEWFSGIVTSSPLDITSAISTGTNTSGATISPTVSTGTLSATPELILGMVVINSGSSAYSSQSPFTDLFNTQGSKTTLASVGVAWGYYVASTTVSVAYGPKWTSARPYGAGVVTFKGTSGGAASGHQDGLLMGVW